MHYAVDVVREIGGLQSECEYRVVLLRLRWLSDIVFDNWVSIRYPWTAGLSKWAAPTTGARLGTVAWWAVWFPESVAQEGS